MTLTRAFKDTVVRHAQEDPSFLHALLEEAAQNVVEGDVETALAQLRDIVNAGIGFDALSQETAIPKTSLMRMLGENGNPRARNLADIFAAIGKLSGIRLSVHADAAKALADA